MHFLKSVRHSRKRSSYPLQICKVQCRSARHHEVVHNNWMDQIGAIGQPGQRDQGLPGEDGVYES